MALNLTPAVKKELFGLSHNLKPVVWVGASLITDNLIREFNLAIDHHELIKVKMALQAEDSAERSDYRTAIVNALLENSPGTYLVKVVGNIAVFYKPSKAKKVEAQLKLARNMRRG